MNTYSGCKLAEFPQGQKSSRLALLFRRRSPEPDHVYHVVRQRHVLLCLAAVDDAAHGNIPPEQRMCANSTEWQPDELLHRVAVGETKHKGDCPVCMACEDALGAHWTDMRKDKTHADLAEAVALKALNPAAIIVSILTIVENLI
jgi:hypothetical protein